MGEGTGGPHVVSRRRWIAAGVALLAVLSVIDHAGFLLVPASNDMAVYHATRARVLRVVAADRVEIDIPDSLNDRPFTTVHLWGVHHAPGPGAEDARSALRGVSAGTEVTLALEPQRTRVPTGELLAHLDLADGGSINEHILATGLVRLNERWSHRRLDRYARAKR